MYGGWNFLSAVVKTCVNYGVTEKQLSDIL
jgi:hypothetical protein